MKNNIKTKQYNKTKADVGFDRLVPSVFCLFLLLGIGSWVYINGVFVELQLLVELPEGWSIASYMSVAIQLSNIFPAIYMLFVSKGYAPKPAYVIYSLTATGVICTILLSVFWNHTTMINGTKHSIVLLILVFIGGAVDCMTSVVYLPIQARYKDPYSSALSTGEACSSLVVGVIGLIQFAKQPPLFGLTLFFLLVAIVLLLSGGAFYLLDTWPVALGERKLIQDHDDDEDEDEDENGVEEGTRKKEAAMTGVVVDDATIPTPSPSASTDNITNTNKTTQPPPITIKEVWSRGWSFLLLQIFLSFQENGTLLSLLPYLLLPYPKGESLLPWATTVAFIVCPLAALSTVYVRWRQTLLQTSIIAVLTLAVIFIVAFTPAVHSSGMGWGAMWIFVVDRALISYVKSMLYRRVQRQFTPAEGEHVFRWIGVAAQIGATAGSVLFFLLIVVGQVFKQ